jgi:hypothetical protein
MTWRGREHALPCRSVAQFVEYLEGLYGGWRPSGIVLHNTASPTLDQWWHGGTTPEQRMVNLRYYYEEEMGWSAGPHAFVDGVTIWIFTDFNVTGVHSPSWNGTRLGIEAVGDYSSEDWDSGGGRKVRELTVALFGECCKSYGWEPNNSIIKLHKEDPATDHDCPGSDVSKSEFISDVTAYMGDGGDHHPDPPQPTEVAGVVYNVPAGDVLNIRAGASSSAPVIGTADNDDKVTIVSDAYNGSTRWYRIRVGDAAGAGVAVYGWASSNYIKRASEPPPSEAGWHSNITATVFGGPGDEQETAYGGYVDSDTIGVALPYKWRDQPLPTVVVEGSRGTFEAPVADLGPWNLDNPEYVNSDSDRRPLAEKQYALGVPAQNGQIPTNDAGIDLTVPVAEAVGVDGKGKVRWRFK